MATLSVPAAPGCSNQAAAAPRSPRRATSCPAASPGLIPGPVAATLWRTPKGRLVPALAENLAFGKFRILQKRMVRGAWVVYDAVETTLERPAELRAFGPKLPSGSPQEGAFIARLKQLAAVDHANVLPMLDFNIVMELGYYTTSPREALPMSQVFAQRHLDVLDESELLERAMALCKAVEAIHEVGAVHGGITSETVYWDSKRSFPYFAWFPITNDPKELGIVLPDVPRGFDARQADVYRVTGIVHQMLTGTAPLADPQGQPSAAINVPGAVEGVHEVLVDALLQDPERAPHSTAPLVEGLEKVLAKQKVRAELEKSVSSMVIPQEILEAALQKKKEQKRRRRKEQGVSPAEAPYVNPLEQLPGGPKTVAGLGLAALLMVGAPFLMTDTSGYSKPPPKAPDRPRPKPKPKPRPGGGKPKPRPKPSSKPKGGDVASLKGASSTSADSFLDRWGILKTWILKLPPSKRRNLFTYGKLVQLRSEFKRDESSACRKLDDLIRQAVNELD